MTDDQLRNWVSNQVDQFVAMLPRYDQYAMVLDQVLRKATAELAPLAIVQTRCASCHAAMPTDASIRVAPKGVHLETLEELKRYAAQIETQAVKSKAMPLGNRTGMLDEERAKLGTWIAKQ